MNNAVMQFSRRLILIVLSTFIALPLFSVERMYVNSKAGLRLRSQASTQGKVLRLLAYGDSLTVLDEIGPEEEISGIKGRWILVDHRAPGDQSSLIGYAFTGFLTDYYPVGCIAVNPKKLKVSRGCFEAPCESPGGGCEAGDLLDYNGRAIIGRNCHGDSSVGTWRIKDGQIIVTAVEGRTDHGFSEIGCYENDCLHAKSEKDCKKACKDRLFIYKFTYIYRLEPDSITFTKEMIVDYVGKKNPYPELTGYEPRKIGCLRK